MAFEPVTFVPYWKSLIDLDIMTSEEVDWLNKYHQDCLEKVGKMLRDQGKDDVYDWLKEITKPVSKDVIAGCFSLTASALTFLTVAITLVCVM